MDVARNVGAAVAFTLSDGFCVDRNRAEFLDLVEKRIDILFANEAEICSLYEVETIEEAADLVAGHCAIACLTQSEKGSLILSRDGTRLRIPAVPTNLVDTTGAGDLFAAGFLASWSRRRRSDLPSRSAASAGPHGTCRRGRLKLASKTEGMTE
jgi:sugar/nucleoside kinase (ribokinase family)